MIVYKEIYCMQAKNYYVVLLLHIPYCEHFDDQTLRDGGNKMYHEKLFQIIINREAEKLRQEEEIFNQHKDQENLWFKLRLVMGYSSVFLLGVIMVISSYIILKHNIFPPTVVTAAGATLFGDVLGLLMCVWKIVLNPTSLAKLQSSVNTAQYYKQIGENINSEIADNEIKRPFQQASESLN